MLSDIYKLGYEKTASLIILPFHQTWTADGHIDQDDHSIRALNWGIIEKGPCSVGIFANRGSLGSNKNCETYVVCVIFLGGSDDREAISYAKRLAMDSRVLRLYVSSRMEENEQNWERMLDSEALRDFKMNCFGEGRVKYIEGVSESGTYTAIRVRKMVNKFDIMIVERRKGLEKSSPQTCGLGEWNDFPELGLLGDLIVTLDINIRASVLAIQQTPPHI